MDNWIKANEAYFGDTFNRDATLCSYTIDGVDLSSDSNIATCSAYIPRGEMTYAKANAENAYTIAKGVNGISTMELCVDDLKVNEQFESITDKLKQLQVQIDALKKRQIITSELRSALKTLHYKREVE